MKQIWKVIAGYENLYEVNSCGKVRNAKTHKELKGKINNASYKRISLCKDGKSRYWLLHRLVAIAFIENSENKPIVNHKNGNTLDNTTENLEWVTHKENMEHASKTGLLIRDKTTIPVINEIKEMLLAGNKANKIMAKIGITSHREYGKLRQRAVKEMTGKYAGKFYTAVNKNESYYKYK
jgi:hypothetical protein